MIYLIAYLLYLFPQLPLYNDPHTLSVYLVSGREGSPYSGTVIHQAKEACEYAVGCEAHP